ncbi:hypothetical protein Ae201684P_018673 [Aphanomyces euteiches]|uniref:Uncharacterized protein n=1 Tax=Aphanomyces euteiches TaxID=100861 RepID=A0A6G0XV26_9STRA|nr:hypothetical protein Ae201684_000825 [Aphanomyces euteiches]KAH9099660.1 hypothetical protein Ae201684P_018673 [Aphanomyces euteiches]KAH9155289.1 hypothetical protein AeRB84_002730 [Aphanomyces euteiches]
MGHAEDDDFTAFVVGGVVVSWTLLGLSYAVLTYVRYLEYKLSKTVVPMPMPPASISSDQTTAAVTADEDAAIADVEARNQLATTIAVLAI